MAAYATDPHVGVLGFAGSKRMTSFPYWTDKHYYQTNCIQGDKNRNILFDHTQNKKEKPLSEVVVLDGMCLFCRKEVWNNIRFDDKNFTGFHIYDIDFSFACAQQYKNYVVNTVAAIHYSQGSFDQKYSDGMILFYSKWKKNLPHSLEKKSFLKGIKVKHSSIRRLFRDTQEKAKLPMSYTINYLKQTDNTTSLFSWMVILQYWIYYKCFYKGKSS